LIAGAWVQQGNELIFSQRGPMPLGKKIDSTDFAPLTKLIRLL